MKPKAFVAAALGEFSWRPPAWLLRVGMRRVGYGALALAGLLALAVGGYLYYQTLQPLRVAANADPPEVSRIERDELVWDSLHLDLRYALTGAETEAPPTLSAARLDLVGEVLEEGIELDPPMPGEWRFETENRLTFESSEDWPADREYRVRLSPELFAPDVELADSTIEFRTPAFVVTILEATFYQHPENVTERRVTASFGFSHPVARDDFEQRLGLELQEEPRASQAPARELGFRVEYGPYDRTAHVHSDIVAIPEREQFATVTVAERLKPANGDGVFEKALFALVRVPDRESYFRVERVNATLVDDAQGDPVQTAAVSFTDHVDTEQFSSRVKAWLLPRDHRIGNFTYGNYRWRSPREVTTEVLARSEPLALTVNPTERDAAMLQSVTFDAPPNRYVYLRIDPGLTSAGDFVMASAYDEVLEAPDYPKEAAIAQEGALLPLTGNRLLTFSGRGVSAVKVDIQQLLPDTLNHLASQTSGDIRDPWFLYRFDADNIAKLTTRIVTLNPGHPRERVYATLDLDEFLDAGGLFFVTVQGWNPRIERVVGSSDRRMALVTDLGLLVKTNADKSQHVFVHSIATGEPVEGAEVELLGKNGLAVLTATTDAQGHARLASADDFERDREPSVFVVRNDSDVTFMPYQRGDRRLRWSGFDIGGEYPAKDDAERLKAALYTDRGLYRPGETARLFGIVREGDFGSVPGAPIELRVADARGNLALTTRGTLSGDGLLAWDFQTRIESPTGDYQANVYLVDDYDHRRHRALGGTTFSVEEYQPDRLRIRAAIIEQVSGAPGDPPATREVPRRTWLKPDAHSARVTLENLFGTPAQGRRVSGSLELTPISPSFSEHPGFVFADPYRDPDTQPKPVTLDLDETVTDEDGVAVMPLDVAQYDNGIYRLLLRAEGFEASGGRGVKALAGTLLSPADALLGYRADGALDFIALEGTRTVRFLAVDRDLEPVAREGLTSVLVERRYVSALVKQWDGTFAYQSVAKETELERTPFELPSGGAEVTLPTTHPGRFALDIVDADGLRLNRVVFAVAGAANVAGNLERDAELDLKLDRGEYAPGDEITVEITAPYAGTGLVTIERDRVYAFKWFRSETNNALASIRLPDDLEGNAYVNVAFVRDIDSEEIFVSPLSYAVAPFTVDRTARRLDIDLSVPERVLPGSRLTIGYAASEPSRLVLFAVDEGILQVADYSTPAPLDVYLRKKALQVETHQMVDLILPDYDVLRAFSAPGGGDLTRLLGANLNPFRRRSEPPVVFWFGILEADSEQRQVDVSIPDYFNGELRVMALGVAETKLGATERPVTIRGPIVLSPNLPLAVAPDDVFDVAVGVANNVDGVDGEVTVTAAQMVRLAAEDGVERTVALASASEGRVRFRLRAGAAPGLASLTLAGRLDDVSVERRSTLSVRPAVAYETSVVSGFDAGGRAAVDLPRRLHEDLASRRVTASASPLALADGLLAYLEMFPHACAEQIVSKAFPQLGLLRAPTFGLDEQEYRTLFRDTIARLRPRQNADGGFLFWTTSTEAAPFASVYITHFLVEARGLRLPVPNDMYIRAVNFLVRLARGNDQQSPFDLATARTRAYAIYLLTRDGVVTTNPLNALHATLETHAGEEWREDIISAYMAASHALLRNDVLAGRLIDGYRLGASSAPDTDFDTRLGRDAQYIYLLAQHFPARMAQLDGDAVQQLVAPVFENRFNTVSAAYTVLALGAIHRSLAARGQLSPPDLVAYGADGPLDVAVSGSVFARASLPVSVERLAISHSGSGGVYYAASESGFDVEVPTDRLAEGIEVDRVYLDDEGDPVERVRVGDELTVRLRVRSKAGRISNVAVTDLLPGGFEILTESVRNRYGLWAADYRDVREDRLLLYGAFDERVTEIRYRVKATNPGEFIAPAAHAAAMYHRSVRGRSLAGRLVVESM